MHWFIIAFIALILLVAAFFSVDLGKLAATVSLATWLSAFAAIVSAVAALVAAILVRKTLSETQAANQLIREQTMHNRAYMTIDVTEIAGVTDNDGNIVSVMIRVNWKNTGFSPALDVVSGGTCFFFKFGEGNDHLLELDVDETLGNGTGSVVAVGNRSMGRAQFNMTDIAQAIQQQEKPIIMSVCRYSDIYGRRYQATFTTLVNWSDSILDPAFTEQILQKGTEFVPFGPNNREVQLTESVVR
ncbi:hypothetical protein [Pseudohongiella sp. O18]|uniref:hypothetical protein n=1 Tax=Pseudohongiella sp. O18 TaxID=2904248 RepID=UPI001F18770C|nr:hypothetical protein [Pseudohongiella sp. O18]